MAHNHLEQLVAEWYEFQGYFVKRNVMVGKRSKGGYECELDVVAFHPVKNKLVHLEPSLDADSWEIREKRYRRKFDAGQKYIRDLFSGIPLPDSIEQIAVLIFASKVNHQTLGGGKILLVEELLEEILTAISPLRLESNAIPEHLVILRSFQFVNQYRKAALKVWKIPVE